MTVIDITERLPHGAYYVACMECAHDWVAVVPETAQWPLECPRCAATAGEKVQQQDKEWFRRYMAKDKGRDHRIKVLINAARMGIEQ